MILLALLGLAFPARAGATNAETPVLDSQMFRPSPDATSTLWADDSHIGPSGFAFRSLLSYTNDPLVFTYDDGRTVGLVSDVLQLDLMPSVRFWRVRLGLDLPFYPAVYTHDQRVVFGDGDWELNGRLVVLDAAVAPFGLGVDGALSLPTGTTDGLRAGAVSGEARVILDKALGRSAIVANVGFRAIPTRALEGELFGDTLTVRLGLSHALSLSSGVDLEVVGSAPLEAALSTPGAIPAEWTLGGWYRHGRLVARGGVGTGLTHGVGSPDVRVIIGVGWERPDGPPDRDHDGVPNADDACPRDPEDIDRFQDHDGCADPDNDDDGIRDADDKCPDAPEDLDHWEDLDGCPEPDTAPASPEAP